MKKYLIGTGLVLGIAILVFLGFQAFPVTASVADNGVYNYKNITSTQASSTNFTVIKAGQGVLGSIIIASSTSGARFKVYDSAGTGATATTSSATSTVITTIPKSAVAGTYTLDVAVTNGIVVEPELGFAGDYIVTWR